jgi:hypothetical protein
MNKFEKLIEYIINDEEQKANDLFHEIVVEKSRSIYESLMDDDEFGGDAADDLVNDIEAEEEGLGEAEDDEYADDEGEMDFDASGELDPHEEEHEETEEETDDLEDRVADLETELDALMAEFDSIMGGGEEEMDVDVDGDMEVGMDDEMPADDMGMDMDDDDMPRESRYKDIDENVTLTKVTKGLSNSTEEGSVNKKSVNADNSGKKGAVAKPVNTDTSEETGRTAETAKDMGYTPTQEAGKKAFKSQAPKAKTSGEEGSVNKKSIN